MASAWAAGPPKVVAAAPPAAADWTLGSAVKLTTSDGEAVSGEARHGRCAARCAASSAAVRCADSRRARAPAPQVFACDRAAEVLVLKAPGAAAYESVLRVLSLSAIKARFRRPGAGDALNPSSAPC